MSQAARESKENSVETACYHCGQPCDSIHLEVDNKYFCCQGCKTVYEILNENNLCEYYSYESNPGIRIEGETSDFAYLDTQEIRKKVLEYEFEGLARVQFFIPGIHCISCIWLLENMGKLDPGILKSEVNFAKKTVRIDFNPNEIALSKVAALLTSTGYKPLINLEGSERLAKKDATGNLVLKLAVAGFCFGNIMLLSFPEYLGMDNADADLKKRFSYLNIFLALPVLVFSGRDYFVAAWKSFSQRQLNIDVPIAIGLVVLFLRSGYDILFHTGPGYLDSLAGLIFFLLIGRWFQGKTYENLSFDRDYRSFFPLAVYKKIDTKWKPVGVGELQKGDEIRVRNNEIIPADGILLNNQAKIDYSFVTGESQPVSVTVGSQVYAGGRLIGAPVELAVSKEASQSHLTSLWNNEVFNKEKSRNYKLLIDQVARYFTWAVLFIALVAALYWYFAAPEKMWLIVTSVLMVACPCALALAAPFTYGSVLRVFGSQGLYLRNTDVVEDMAGINSIVFDKTGTITHGANDVEWIGKLSEEEWAMVKTLAGSSTHPLSVLISKSIKVKGEPFLLTYFEEVPGRGIRGQFNGLEIKLGSSEFVKGNPNSGVDSKVFVSIGNELRGYFSIGTVLRPGVRDLIKHLGSKVTALLSGDGFHERTKMNAVFPATTHLVFNQTPQDKLKYISTLQRIGNKVMMIGDGLNDSGALKQSDVGIAVTDDTSVFTPSCDGILKGDKLVDLNKFITLSHAAIIILKISLVISLLYNVVGIGFAISGYLTPLVAAILMPISSISVVSFTSLAVKMAARKIL